MQQTKIPFVNLFISSSSLFITAVIKGLGILPITVYNITENNLKQYV
jgi:hypothetical protein